ncbi:LytR C-terminal domain-containing protein [bacterium]|nr:LytR C-terminal domain-containing protein [bacterium]
MRRVKLILFFIFMAAVWWIYWNREAERRWARDVEMTLKEGRRVSAMVLATDAHEGLAAAVLVSYEPPSGRAVFLNVPQNLCLDAVLEDTARIRRGGAATTLEAAFARESLPKVRLRLQKLFGSELALVSVLPANRFFRLVDLMGGVYLDVPARISFRSAQTQTSPVDRAAEWIEIPGGENVFFDSDKSEMYLSYRYDGLGVRGQLFRARRFAAAFFGRLNSFLKQSWFAAEFAASFRGANAANLMSVSAALAGVLPESLDVVSLPGRLDPAAGVFWMSRRELAEALPKELKPLIAAGAPKSRITVQLLNGSGVPHAASLLREKLAAFADVDVVELGNADRFDYEKTRIIDRAGHLGSAERIRDLLRAGVLQQDINPKPMVDVTVVIGRDALN